MSRAAFCVDVPGQMMAFDTGEPVRRRPSPEELDHVLREKSRIAVLRWHRGRPPRGMTFDDLIQSVILGALERTKNFRHGGVKTLGEFVYVACCFSLADIQRKDMRVQRPPPDYPLLDHIESFKNQHED